MVEQTNVTPKEKNPVQSVQPVIEPVAEKPVEKPMDIVDKINKTPEQILKKETQEPVTLGFDYKELEKIVDPIAKEQAMRAYKSMQADYTRKTKELAEERKQLESDLQRKGWSPQRIQELLKDPEFVQSVQIVANQNPQEEELFSSLSQEEKNRIFENEKRVQMLVEQNQRLQLQQQDELLKTKYANYNPQAVYKLRDDLIAGRVQATNEELYKVIDYDNAIRRAYELGKQDRQLEVKDKMNVVSYDGVNIAQAEEPPKREANESSRDYFMRIGNFRLKQAQLGKLPKQ